MSTHMTVCFSHETSLIHDNYLNEKRGRGWKKTSSIPRHHSILFYSGPPCRLTILSKHIHPVTTRSNISSTRILVWMDFKTQMQNLRTSPSVSIDTHLYIYGTCFFTTPHTDTHTLYEGLLEFATTTSRSFCLCTYTKKMKNFLNEFLSDDETTASFLPWNTIGRCSINFPCCK